MHSLLGFFVNSVFFSTAWLFGLWIESFAYWYMPDAFFLLVVWLLFVQNGINFFALVFASLLFDIYLENFFGSHLLALTLVLYVAGMLNFSRHAQTPIVCSWSIFIIHLCYGQIMLFINLGPAGLLDQQLHFAVTKSLSTALIWLVIIQLSRLHRHRYQQI